MASVLQESSVVADDAFTLT